MDPDVVQHALKYVAENGSILESWGVPRELVTVVSELHENVWVFVRPASGAAVRREAERGVTPRKEGKVIHSRRGALQGNPL